MGTVLNIWVAQMRGNFLDVLSQNQILSSLLLSYETAKTEQTQFIFGGVPGAHLNFFYWGGGWW